MGKMDKADENVQKPRNKTPRRLCLGLRSPRNHSTHKTSSTSKLAAKIFLSTVIDDSTLTKKLKIDSDALDVEEELRCSSTALEPETLPSSYIPLDERSIDEIQMNTIQMEIRLAKYEKYEERTIELTKLIEIWRAGGQAAIKILQDAINPKQELAVILKHLNLSESIFDVGKV